MIAAVHHYDNNNLMHFFVVKEFTEDRNVIGKFLTPDLDNPLYSFGEEETLPIDDFTLGFDLVYYGDTFGKIEYDKIYSRLRPNIAQMNQ